MTQSTTRETNALDTVYDHFRMGEFLAAVYEGSEYRFGTLAFREPAEDEPRSRDELIAPRPGVRMWVYSIPILLHPDKGVLIFGVPNLPSRTARDEVSGVIEEEHSRLVQLEHKIRARLEEIGYWHAREIVFGVGLVSHRRLSDDQIPASVPAEIVVDRNNLANFASHAEQIFEYYTTRNARPVSQWGPRLIDDLTDSPRIIGGFLDEQHLIDGHEQSDREFDGLVLRAADMPRPAVA